MRTDEDLMCLRQCGDNKAFSILYRRHHADLSGFVARRLGHEAEEVAQVTWVQVYTTMQWFSERKPFVPYLYRIAERWVADFRAKPCPAKPPTAAITGKYREGWQFVQSLAARC